MKIFNHKRSSKFYSIANIFVYFISIAIIIFSVSIFSDKAFAQGTCDCIHGSGECTSGCGDFTNNCATGFHAVSDCGIDHSTIDCDVCGGPRYSQACDCVADAAPPQAPCGQENDPDNLYPNCRFADHCDNANNIYAWGGWCCTWGEVHQNPDGYCHFDCPNGEWWLDGACHNITN